MSANQVDWSHMRSAPQGKSIGDLAPLWRLLAFVILIAYSYFQVTLSITWFGEESDLLYLYVVTYPVGGVALLCALLATDDYGADALDLGLGIAWGCVLALFIAMGFIFVCLLGILTTFGEYFVIKPIQAVFGGSTTT